MVNFIVCDDEIEITNLLKNLITKIMFKTNIEYKIHVFNNYNTDFNKIIKEDLENKIYILDIEVNKKSGIDIAKKIRINDWNSIILILSAHNELEHIAYKSKILLFDFISKFDLYDKKISETIITCVNQLIKEDKLKIRVNRKIEQIHYNNILYLTYDSYSRKLRIVTKTKEYETNATLKEIMQKLKGRFIYTHRSCIVNLDNVKEFDFIKRKIIFKDKEIDLLSRTYIKEVREYANN